MAQSALQNYRQKGHWISKRYSEWGRLMSKAKPPGRPVGNIIERIPATAEQIAKAVFKAANKKLSTSK